MWPWEHVAFGYLLYSLSRHATGRGPPRGGETVAVVVGALLPDLVDKPLSWSLGVFPSGYAVGHSVFVAPFVWVAAVAVGRRVDRSALGVAVSLGYASHLVGDVVYPLVRGRGLAFYAVLWPLVTVRDAGANAGLLDQFWRYFHVYLAHLRSLDVDAPLLFTLALGVIVVTVWVYDGMPVLSDVWSFAVARGGRR